MSELTDIANVAVAGAVGLASVGMAYHLATRSLKGGIRAVEVTFEKQAAVTRSLEQKAAAEHDNAAAWRIFHTFWEILDTVEPWMENADNAVTQFPNTPPDRYWGIIPIPIGWDFESRFTPDDLRILVRRDSFPLASALMRLERQGRELSILRRKYGSLRVELLTNPELTEAMLKQADNETLYAIDRRVQGIIGLAQQTVQQTGQLYVDLYTVSSQIYPYLTRFPDLKPFLELRPQPTALHNLGFKMAKSFAKGEVIGPHTAGWTGPPSEDVTAHVANHFA